MQGAGFEYVRYPHKMGGRFPSRGDKKLIQIVDSALADVTQRSGKWLACRPGCTQCCVGAFPINQLDALRLLRGLADLEKRDPKRAGRIRQRARESVVRLTPEFPGDPVSWTAARRGRRGAKVRRVCERRALSRARSRDGICELYESRPMTCRVFGPPVRSEDGLGVCELCFQGASDKEIAACEMNPDPDDLESRLLKDLEKGTGKRGDTIIAFCLAS